VLVRQLDPRTNGRLHRDLPPAPDGSVFTPKSAAERVADCVAGRIEDGSWAGEKFPLVTEICEELGCGLGTVCEAMRLLQARGVVHKIQLRRGVGEKGRDRVWRPVSVASQDNGELGRWLEPAIRRGELTGVLPNVVAMATQQRMSAPLVAAEYQRLTELGLIASVWLPDLSQQVWHVMGTPASQRLLTGTKAMAIAAVLLRRMPEWLQRKPRGQWARRPLPRRRVLGREYTTHVFSVQDAQDILVGCGVIERAPIAQPLYLPVPPQSPDDCGVKFVVDGLRRGYHWVGGGEPRPWKPLPATEEEARPYLLHRQRRASGEDGEEDEFDLDSAW
jgi:DNA-binding transcriptional regulator YhcF (GntR family)